MLSLSTGRKLTASVEMSAAEKKKLAASKKNGKKIAIPMMKLPSGGPIRLFIAYSVDQSLPFAFWRFSSLTTLGRNVCAELSRSTSAKPNSKAEIARTE